MNETESPASVFATFVKQIILPERPFYLACLLYGVAVSLLTLAVPLSVQTLVNSVANTALPQVLFAITLLLAVLLSLYALLNALQLYVLELFERRFFLRVAARVAADRLDGRGDLPATPFSRFFEVVHVQKSVPSLVVGGFSLCLQTLVGLVVVAFYHPVLLAFVLVLALACVAGWRVWHRAAAWGALAVCEQKYAVADYLEHLERTAGRDQKARDHAGAEALAFGYLAARRRFFRHSFAQTVTFLTIYVVGSVGLLGLGGTLVIRGQLTLGQLAAAELILSSILLGLSKAGYFLTLYYELCAGALKLDGLLADTTPGRTGPAPRLWASIKLGSATRLSLRMVAAGLVVTAAALAFVPWVQTAGGGGRITALDPDGQPQNIHALVKGRIKKWYVRDGSRVAKDDPVLEIVDNDPLLLERLEAEAAAARKGRQAAHAAALTAALDVKRNQDLFDRGLASRRDMEKARIEHESWLAREAEAVAKIASAETKLSRQQTQLVRAPRDGLIVRTAAGDAATLIEEGDVVASFVPASVRKAAELYVSGLDAPLVRPGRKVRLQFEGWPSVQFSGWPATAVGTFAGEVLVADPAVSANGRFRVLVVEPAGEPWPNDSYLRFGSRVKGWVLLDTVPLGYELWRQMNGFPPESGNAGGAGAGNEAAGR